MDGLSDEDLMVSSELAFMSGLNTEWENLHKCLRVPLRTQEEEAFKTNNQSFNKIK